MRSTSHSGMPRLQQLHTLIRELKQRAELLSGDIADTEQKAHVFNVKHMAYPLVALNLRGRRAHLLATIAGLEEQLKPVSNMTSVGPGAARLPSAKVAQRRT
jgi:hypothetical protein